MFNKEITDDWMQTYKGGKLDLRHPKPEDFDIETVAHSLSLKCRFNGQCSFFYSVGLHSILVSKIIAPEFALQGLLHELDEVFLPDIPRPLKALLGTKWKEISNSYMEAGARAFRLPWPMSEEVHYADAQMLATEKVRLMPNSPEEWVGLPPALDIPILELSWNDVKQKFLHRYHELTA